MKNNIDLHMHSIYSDGTCTPAELVICARQKGLSAISLTDHDTTDGLKEAREQCKLQCFSQLRRRAAIGGLEIS